jgi:hypothetical protein
MWVPLLEKSATRLWASSRKDLLPARPRGGADVDSDHTIAGSFEVRAEVKERPVVSEKLVGGVEFVEEPRNFASGRDVLKVHAIPLVGSVRDVEDRVRSVIRDVHVEAPLGLVRPFVDEPVL